MNGDNKAAVSFLQLLYPEGPWVLTAINKSKGARGKAGATIRGAAFYPGQETELETWLSDYNGAWNIYYSANEVIDTNTTKSTKQNIRAVHYLYVDVDPDAGKDIDQERSSILQKLKSYSPPPTFIVFSGGGYQALWKLQSPIRIDGDLQRAVDAELYNIALEQELGGDHCHNVDRILRLPGTVNVPDEKKLEKGRKRELARLELHEPKHQYDVVMFKRGQRKGADYGDDSGGEGAVPPENVPRLNGVEDLDKWKVPDRVKVIIVQGRYPDEIKEGDNSRSAWLFDVVCNLMRCDVPDDVIYSIITDPDFRISESVLEKDNPRNYALKQIRSGREFSIRPELREMNDRFFLLGDVGRICHFSDNGQLVRQDVTAFKLWLENRSICVGRDKDGNEKYMKLAQWWLQHSQRRQYEYAEYAPEHETPPSVLNMWRGFAFKAKPGDCSLYLDHLRTVICSGNEEYYNYLINWMAHAVQKPNQPGQVAVVIRGHRGTGKGIAINSFGRLFGRHYMTISNAEQLVGKFNGHLEQCSVLFCDEAFYAGDKRHESVLKALITEELMAVERKGVDVTVSRNVLHLMMASNEDWVVPAGTHERRFFVLTASNDHIQDKAYFGALVKQLENGGYEALLAHLKHIDLSDFEVRNVPHTGMLQEQQEMSMGPVEGWWYDCLREGEIGRFGWPEAMPRFSTFEAFQSTSGGRGKTFSQITFGRTFMKLLQPRVVKRHFRVKDDETGAVETRVCKAFELPPLGLARERFEEAVGRSLNWPEVPEMPRRDEAEPF